mmetsp:Transcript_25087/g.64829  ORF Transcript_25087/g.64829 Transcript_25087/m.64829 type:complete len:223 (-) Transcript_25087:262-930(-)
MLSGHRTDADARFSNHLSLPLRRADCETSPSCRRSCQCRRTQQLCERLVRHVAHVSWKVGAEALKLRLQHGLPVLLLRNGLPLLVRRHWCVRGRVGGHRRLGRRLRIPVLQQLDCAPCRRGRHGLVLGVSVHGWSIGMVDGHVVDQQRSALAKHRQEVAPPKCFFAQDCGHQLVSQVHQPLVRVEGSPSERHDLIHIVKRRRLCPLADSGGGRWRLKDVLIC